MITLPRREVFAVTAVLDIALHARPSPVAARALAERLDLPPRHLETLLQALVRHGILKGSRGPKGGYELARERRRITVGDILRAAGGDAPGEVSLPGSTPLGEVVTPILEAASARFLAELDGVTVEDLCKRTAPAFDGTHEPLHDIGL
jgi:Rrf2 family iron-sulfur cluster assembly transcriptional regulator